MTLESTLQISQEESKRRWLIPMLIALGSIVLLGFVLSSQQSYFADESWHLNTVGSVHKYGWGRTFFERWHDATGPLVAWTHWLLEPVTQLKLPAVRLVNTGLLLIAMTLTAVLLKLVTNQWAKGFAGALGLLALVPIWKISGMVYAEMPALVMAMLAITGMWLATQGSQKRGVLFAVISGVFMSLAILGRQPFLLAVPMAVAAALFNGKNRACLLVFFVTSLLFPLWVFGIWGGLQSSVLKSAPGNASNMLGFGLSGLGYMGAFALMLQPAWLFGSSRRRLLLWAVFGGLVFACFSLSIPFTPAEGVMNQLPSWLRQPARLCGFFVLGGMAVIYVRALVEHAWRGRREGFRAWVLASLCVLSLVPGAIGPLFSTRYLITALPFLVVELVGFQRLDRFFPWRCCLGLALGALSLWSHLGVKQGPAFWDNRMEIFYPHLWRGSPEAFAPEQWSKFDYGRSPFIQNPRWGGAVRHPTDTTTWQWPGEP